MLIHARMHDDVVLCENMQTAHTHTHSTDERSSLHHCTMLCPLLHHEPRVCIVVCGVSIAVGATIKSHGCTCELRSTVSVLCFM
jgi:hypothetical protein